MVPQPDEVINIANFVNHFLQWRSINGHPRNYDVYHPSEFGRCLRKMQYNRYASGGIIAATVPEALDPRLCRVFDTGHSMHDRWAKIFAEAGVLRGVWECTNPECRKYDDSGAKADNISGENNKPRTYGDKNKIGEFRPEKCSCGNLAFRYKEITVEDKSLNIKGSADQILDFSNFDPDLFKKGNKIPLFFDPKKLPKTPIVNDMKSINSNQFDPKGFRTAKLPKFEHEVQLCIYANILDLEYGTLIYENKDTSEIKVFQVDRSPALWNKIKEQTEKMNEMASQDRPLLPPPRPEKKDNYECRDCAFKPICHSSKIWQDPNLASKRDKFYSINVSA